jgi:hypothetical protein
MIRFERPPVELSKKKKRWRLLLFLFGIGLLIYAIFFSPREFLRGNFTIFFWGGYFVINYVLGYLPVKLKKQMPFVEIDDQQIKWNNYEAENNKDISSTPVVLNWSAIKWIKLLHNNKLVFFEASSFDSQLWLHHYPADQQQIIIDTIKVYGERFSLHWVEEQKESAVA